MTARSGLFVAPTAGVGTAPTDARLALAGIIGTTPQCVQGGAITQSATSMQFTIAQAVMQLPDPTNAAAAFLSPIDQTTLTPAAGPATGSRVDLIVGKQNNPENGDADSRASFSLIAGVAGAPGLPPAVPAGYFRYADINVPALASNAAACTVTLRSPTTFAPIDLECSTLALLKTVTGQLGQCATVTADGMNNGIWMWYGSSWLFAGVGPWTAYTPTLTGIAVGNGTLTARARREGENVRVAFVLLLGSTTTMGIPQLSLPVASVTPAHAFESKQGVAIGYSHGANTPYLMGILAATSSTTAVQIVPNNSGAVATAISSSNPFSWVAGDYLSGEFTYRAA